MKNGDKILGGLILAFGFPGMVWIYADWRAGLATFLALQFLLVLSKGMK